MKPPLLSIRGKSESAALLDRGGRPTLREFLSGLEFDPGTGTLRLNGARVTLQLAEADRILRRELIRQMGEAEARIFMLRRGFRMGRNDADFVASSWPMLDRGDAFTAGTRLHMFSGIVRVETVHNDFDFARGRFSAEFLWHNSLEADEGDGGTRHAERPVCWQQLGYASGYASHFFGALVVYKETACAAQGHRACRVVGKLAEGWGEDDPEVALFRARIIGGDTPGAAPPSPRRVIPAATAAPPVTATALLAPVMARLQTAAALVLPCLIAGHGHCGQDEAATALINLLPTNGTEDLLRLDAARITPEALHQAFDPPRTGGAGRKRSRPETQLLLIERAESLSPDAQAELLARIRPIHDMNDLRLILTAGCRLSALRAGGFSPALWARLAPLALDLPALPQHPDLPAVMAERLRDLARGLGLPLPPDTAGILAGLAPAPADLDQLDGMLAALLVAAHDGRDFDPATLATPAAMPVASTPGSDWIAAQLAAGRFSLPAHEAEIRAIALAQAGGNLSAAARLLGISRAQLSYREQNGRG